MAGALVGATSGSVGLVDDGPGPHGVGASVFTPMSLALVAAGLGLAARTALGCGAQMLEWGLVVAGVGVGLAQSFGIATAMDTVPAEAEGSGVALLAAEEEDWLESLAVRVELVASTPELEQALWAQSSVWTTALAEQLPTEALSARVQARALAGACLEGLLAWRDRPAFPDTDSLVGVIQEALNAIRVPTSIPAP
ncbi:hypothetical protein HMPREF2883_04365 [Actinomyces sp. HMSC075C01]|uniref:Uncharacterized protein n=1 Tax=Actinomyces oris TaxID=544580 RepID=A0A1Q8W0Y4_9ACTO|nr:MULTISPECIES: hypothetical protein [Actinomyces]OFR54838.1 hypothetical protein HMPREF2883_04365 [Actinomyces sp. HMSC075C01]OLO54695.1 hypothetical protein BKH27_03635 [Actinomyces oris]